MHGRVIAVGLVAVALLGLVTGGVVFMSGRSEAEAVISAVDKAGVPDVRGTSFTLPPGDVPAPRADPRLGWLDDQWTSTTSPSGHFTLDMPAGTTTFTESDYVMGQQIEIAFMITESAGEFGSSGLAFGEIDMGGLTGVDFDRMGASDIETAMREGADGGARGLGGTIDGYEVSPSDLGPARAFEGRAPGVVFRGFIALHKARLVFVLVMVPQGYDQLADDVILRSAGTLRLI